MINRRKHTHRRKILLIIKLVLILMLGHLIVKTAATPEDGQEKFSTNLARASERAIVADSSKVEENQVEDYSAVLKRDLFGNGVSERKTPVLPSVDISFKPAPSVGDKLDIALLGTVAGSPAVSRAIIKNLETNVLAQYKTGDKILTATIELIEKDRVVLLHKGQRRVLTLRVDELKTDGGQARETVARTAAPKSIPVSKAPAAANTFADKLKRAAVMLPEATVEHHTVDGQVDGLKISDIGNLDGVEDLGLKDGDVIRAVNGHQLDSKQKAFQIAMKARSQEALSVELQRDNKIRNFSLPLK